MPTLVLRHDVQRLESSIWSILRVRVVALDARYIELDLFQKSCGMLSQAECIPSPAAVEIRVEGGSSVRRFAQRS
jgi:hypothetical protein